ncbi:hypothetical protein BKA57DRAFT_429798 [Linnemannia elongata]|nr:hypothetical protein BKA57DRAFT_429798 [Linnemannia elongata]
MLLSRSATLSPDSLANGYDRWLPPAQVFLIFDTDKEYQDMIKVETQQDSFGDMVVYWTDIMHLHENAIYLKDDKGMVATFVKDDDTSETRVPLRVLYSRDPLTIIVHKPPPDHVVLPLSKGLRIEPERTLSASTRIRKKLYRALFRANSVPIAPLESTGAYHHQEMRTEGAETLTLAEALEELRTNSTLTSLNLRSNKIGDDGAQALSEALKTNSTLTTLDLYNNSIGPNGAQALSKALKTNSTLTTLNIHRNRIGPDGAQALSEALKTNSTLTTFNLSFNRIGNNGAQALFKALQTNSTLSTLDLSFNLIGDDGTQALSEALKTNSTLTTLNLEFNPIGDNGTQALSEALKTNSTVTIAGLRLNAPFFLEPTITYAENDLNHISDITYAKQKIFPIP